LDPKVVTRLDVLRFKTVIREVQKERREALKRAKEKRRRTSLHSMKALTAMPILRRLIGSGSFGVVYLAEYERRKIAVKRLAPEMVQPQDNEAAESDRKEDNKTQTPKDSTSETPKDSTSKKEEDEKTDDRFEDMLYEAEMLRAARFDKSDKKTGFHSHIVELYAIDTKTDPKSPRLLMEFITGGSLAMELEKAAAGNIESIFHADHPKNILDRNEGIEDPVLFHVVRVAKGIASALMKIHENGILHLDISARNIFLDDYKRPKIGDFGSAVEAKSLLDIYNDSKRGIMVDDVDYRLFVGDVTFRKYREKGARRPVAWMPDWVLTEEYGPPLIDWHVDVYSFGCVLFELTQKCSPHAGLTNEQILHLKKCGQGNPAIPTSTDRKLAEMMEECWAAYKDQRPFTEICFSLGDYHRDLKNQSSETRDMNTAYSQLRAMLEVLKEAETLNLSILADDADSTTMIRKKLKFEIGANEFLSVIDCSMRFRDYLTILKSIKFITNSGDARVTQDSRAIALAHCMDCLSALAGDAHASIDEGEHWKELAQIIVTTCFTVIPKLSQTKTAISVNERKLVVSSLHAVKLILEINISKIYLVEDIQFLRVPELIFRLYQDCFDQTDIMQANVSLTQTVSLTSLEISALLYSQDVLPILVRCMQKHADKLETVLSCLKTLGTFSLAQLLLPSPASNESAKNVPAPVNAKHQLQTWNMLFSAIFSVVITCAREGFPDPKQKMLETALLTLYRTCEKSIFYPELLEHFLYSVSPDTIQVLLRVLHHYREVNQFRLQEGAVGLLSHILRTGMQNATLTVTVAEIVDTVTEANDQESFAMRESEGCIGTKSMTRGTEHFYESKKTLPSDGRTLATATAFQEIPLPTPNETRVKALVSDEESLKLLLDAMERFQTDEKLASLLKTKPDLEGAIVNTSSRSSSRSLNSSFYSSTAAVTTGITVLATATNHYGNKQTSKGGMTVALSGGAGDANGNGFGEAFAEGFQQGIAESIVDVALYLDEDGEEITAASLQKSVASILGRTCEVLPAIQFELLRTRYNLFILKAFDTFSNDVQLIRLGSDSLYYICRRNAGQQRSLYNLNVIKHLSSVFAVHRSESLVAESILLTMTGLLEPDPVELRRSHSNSILSYQFCEALTKPAGVSGLSALQEIALQIAKQMVNEESTDLTSNYLKLLCSCLFWNIGLLMFWWKPRNLFLRTMLKYGGMTKQSIIDDYLDSVRPEEFVDFQNLTYFESIQRSLLKELGRLAGYQAGKVLISKSALQQQASEYERSQQRTQNSNNIVPAMVVATQSLQTSAAPVTGVPLPPTADAAPVVPGQVVNPTEAAAALNANIATENRGQKRADEGNLKALLQVELFRKCSLYDFVRFSMVHHSKDTHVIGLGLSLMVCMVRFKFLKEYQLGQDIEYHDDEAQPLWWCRYAMLSWLFPHFLLFGEREQLQNLDVQNKHNLQSRVLIIRYTLWTMVLFVSERREKTGTTLATEVSSEFCIQGGLEWTVEVLQRFPKYYSLQSLAIVFLTWMEYHGCFFTRNIEKLEMLHKVLKSILEREDIKVDSRGEEISNFYLPLREECEDRLLLNGKLLETFGDIELHARKLLELVEAHIAEQRSEIVIDKMRKNKLNNHDDLKGTSASTSSAVNRKLGWDGRNRPYSAKVIFTAKEEDPHSRRNFDTYTVQIFWEDEDLFTGKKQMTSENKWTVTKVYKDFEVFYKRIVEEFADIGTMITKVIPAEPMFFKANYELFWLDYFLN
jgi:serine/threonine protein kinase